ncbi:MAG: folylpolyglutamate synthase/dihydrofolate synthase family protein [Chthoniobacterales bacterium]
MTYQESLEWLFSTQKFGIKLGLENVWRLLDVLGNPQDELKFIHVAGTNGKGSVCAMTESILRAAGYRTGLFTSPHLVDFCERIQVSGNKIPEHFVTKGLNQIHDLSATWDHAPTFFEIATALALVYFAHEKCDIVILETGMGGRLDATNAITPLVAVLTPIALDHQQWLGHSLTEIATEKAGIIKEGIPVVSALQQEDAARVFAQTAQEKQTSLIHITTPVEDVKIGLTGGHQKLNAALAIAAIRAAGLKVSEADIKTGLEKVSWPGRFQIINERYVLDGGHNPAGVGQLVITWREYFGNQKPVVIFGTLKDKDASGMLASLREIAARFVLVPVDSDRTVSPEHLKEDPTISGIEISACASLQEALKATKDESPVLIAGSLFLIGEALAFLEGNSAPRRSLQ